MKGKRFSTGIVAGAIVLAIVLVGCSGSSGSGEMEGASQAPSTTVTPSLASASSSQAPTPTEEFATVEQYASVVAANRRDIEEYTAKVDECSLGWPEGDLVCGLAPFTLALQARVLEIQLSEEAKPEDRLPPPPPEIQDLVAKTVEVAGALKPLADALEGCDRYEDCASEWYEMAFAAGELQDIIDAWSPYL